MLMKIACGVGWHDWNDGYQRRFVTFHECNRCGARHVTGMRSDRNEAKEWVEQARSPEYAPWFPYVRLAAILMVCAPLIAILIASVALMNGGW